MLSDLGYLGFYLKDRRLKEFNTLRDEDMNARNLEGGGSPYINNFIYIPSEHRTKIERVRAFLSGS
jgi:hypothetical protein